jgi:fatty-acyl-CoA synthase
MTPSYASGTTLTPLLGETIGANLERTVKRVPDAVALVSVHQGVRFSYAELNDMIDLVARGLLDFGLQVGDRLGIWSPNHAEWVLIQYATAKIGVILVNLNPAYRSSELTYALNQSGCRMLVAAQSFKTTDYRAIVESIRADVAGLERVVYLGSADWDALRSAGQTVAMDRLVARAGITDFDDPINIQYTSGTTGSPKGATLSHHNILNTGYFVGEALGYDETDRVCIPVPFYHCFGMVMGNLACTSHGAAMILPDAAFDAAAVLEAVEAERCTSLYGVPTMFISELAHPSFATHDLSSLRTGIMAGSPCPVEVMKQVISSMGMEEVTICYGMTETSPVSTQTSPHDTLDKRVGTVGQIHPHVEIKIIDPSTGRTVAKDESGELLTRGYSVMLGYWDDPARSAEAIDRAGWMHTGDLATMDIDGYVNIVGRIKDLIIRGGENVYPREVEEFLYSHPDIEDVQVIGVPDLRYGEEIMAWVRVREGASLDAEVIRQFCRDRIAHFKVPRYVKFVDDFPLTVTGKVQKYKMREQAVIELGLEEAASTRTA